VPTGPAARQRATGVYCQSGGSCNRRPYCSDPGDDIDEDALELYALGRLTDEGQPAAVEKQLLNCKACRERLRAQNEFVRLLRAGLRRV